MMREEKKGQGAPMVLILVVVLALVLLTGLVIIFALQQETEEVLPPKEPEEEEPPVTNITEEEPPELNDDYYYDTALSTTNATLCGLIGNQSMRQLCYENLAMESLDACREVANQTLNEECVMHFATSLEDAGLCGLLVNRSLECMIAVNPCYEKEGNELLICLALSENDPTECQNDSDCLFNYSITKGEDHCSEIEDAVQKQACLSVLKNTDKCYGLESPALKDRCYYLYALHIDNKNLCYSVHITSPYALDCFSEFAVRKNNATVCDVSQFELNDRWNCYINYTMATGDVDGCSYIHELATTHVFQCYFNYAKKYGDPSACDFIGDVSSVVTCYTGTLIDGVELDTSTCADVQYRDWRYKCYTESAKQYNDVSFCDNIVEEPERDACINAYELYVSGD